MPEKARGQVYDLGASYLVASFTDQRRCTRVNPKMSSRRTRRTFTWKHPLPRSRDDVSFGDASSSYRQGLSLLEEFLDTPSKSPRLQYEESVFRRLFCERDLEMIRDGQFKEDTTERIWLCDHNDQNKPRDGNGLMSARRLSEMLKFKVRYKSTNKCLHKSIIETK